jgi:hypothetical protein
MHIFVLEQLHAAGAEFWGEEVFAIMCFENVLDDEA